jgi:hypothetical protein
MIATIEDIELAISHLSQEDLAKFRNWYYEFDAKVWDEQIERDIKEGKLNTFADKIGILTFSSSSYEKSR